MPETRSIIIRPPKEWSTQPDFVPGGLWLAKTKWYGERDAAQDWQEFLAKHHVELGGIRGVRDATKFYFPDKSLYVDTHVDGMHVTGPDDSMLWLEQQLLAKGGQAEAGNHHA